LSHGAARDQGGVGLRKAVREIKDQISMIEVLYHETDAFQEAQGQGEDLKGAEHLGRRTDQGNEASTSGPGKVIRQHIKKFVQVLPVNSFAYAQYDHLRRTIDVLIALGKDPRKGEMSPTEITTAISRDRLPTPVRIEWNKKTKADQTMAANLGRYLQFLEEQAELLEDSLLDSPEAGRPMKLEPKI
ncbi:hypothetical protein T4C_414, partial [Trichinella pseudospiralis]